MPNYSSTKLEQIEQKLDQKDIDNFVVSDNANLFYLLGIYNFSGHLILTNNERKIIASNFYKYTLKNFEIDAKIYNNHSEKSEILRKELKELPEKIYSDSPASIQSERPEAKIEELSLIKKMRQIKLRPEVEKIRKAGDVSAQALKAIRENLEEGKTEWELASIADKKIREMNCYNAFETLVHSKALEPHRSPQDKKVEEELVLVDLGAKYKGYCSDVSRTFCLNPTEEQQKLYNDVLDIYNQIFDKIKPGAKFSDLTQFARELASKKGYSLDKNYLHRIGHSLGVEIHEQPGFGLGGEAEIKKGMVFTLEPGLYKPDIGGVRIEDTLYIDRKGNKQILTDFPKELTV